MTRVLFVHGLESGPTGTKVIKMRALGFEVYAADMQMSLFRLKKKNSVLRNILRRPVVIGVALLYVGLSVVGFMGHAVGLIVVAHIVALLTLFLMRKSLFRKATSASLEQCVAIQEEAIRIFSPDVIVGASWGGAVTLELVRRSIWGGPIVLLAPAYLRALLMAGVSDDEIDARLDELEQRRPERSVILHDPTDDTVPFTDSEIVSQRCAIAVESVSAGGHRLLGILEDGTLQNQIQRVTS